MIIGGPQGQGLLLLFYYVIIDDIELSIFQGKSTFLIAGK
jgi:hypothetical protein